MQDREWVKIAEEMIAQFKKEAVKTFYPENVIIYTKLRGEKRFNYLRRIAKKRNQLQNLLDQFTTGFFK